MRYERLNNKRYILITPVKNEEKLLPDLIQSIVQQTVRPVLWVIVNDGSQDKTTEIVKIAIEKNSWIQTILLKEFDNRDRGVHLAKVIRRGIDFAYHYCEKNRIEFDYLGNVDADVVFEKSYFEKLMEKFENDTKIGIASGGLWIKKGPKTVHLNLRYPDGGDVLYRRSCFEECGGYPSAVACDSVLNVKARLRGWEIKRFDDIEAHIARNYCHGGNLWREYKKVGESAYIVSYNLFYAIAKGLKLSFEAPYYIGCAYLYGYFISIIRKKEQINDDEVKYYFQHMRPKEINRHHFEALKNILRK